MHTKYIMIVDDDDDDEMTKDEFFHTLSTRLILYHVWNWVGSSFKPQKSHLHS